MVAASEDVSSGGLTLQGSRWPVCALASVLFAMAALFTATMLRSTDGHLSPPLDDTLIYFQYARQIAHGEIFVYINGDPRTSGATSFAYPFLLGTGYAIGFRDANLVIFGLTLAFVLLGSSVLLTFRITRHLMGEGAAWTAALLVIINGWLLWTIFSMMETGLHAVALLAALYAFILAERSRRSAMLAAVLFAFPFVRPEMTMLGPAIAVFWLLSSSYLSPNLGWAARLSPLAVALAGSALYFGLMTWLTGDARTDTFLAKSILARDYLDWSTQYREIRGNFFEHLRYGAGSLAPSYLWILIGGFGLLGAGALIIDDVRDHRPTVRSLIPLLFLGGTIAASTPIGSEIHHHRWAAPYLPLLVLMLVRGVASLHSLAPLRGFWWAAALTLTCASLWPMARLADQYGRNSSDIYNQQTKAAFWLRDNTPADAVIGLNDAGAMPYYSRRRAYDLIGLVTQDSAEAFIEGPASVFERIEALPPVDQPDYYAIYPFGMRFAEDDIGFLRQINIFVLDDPTIAGGPWKIIYEADNRLLGAGDSPRQLPRLAEDWRLVDRLDVAELDSEQAHSYRYHSLRTGTFPVQPLLAREYEGEPARIIDGGRVIVAESLRFDAEAGKPWLLLMRATGEGARLNVTANGINNSVVIPPSTGWLDIEVARGDSVDDAIELTVTSQDGTAYAAYSYWLLQP